MNPAACRAFSHKGAQGKCSAAALAGGFVAAAFDQLIFYCAAVGIADKFDQISAC